MKKAQKRVSDYYSEQMTNRLVTHVGLARTGSTYLQGVFSRLSSEKVDYNDSYLLRCLTKGLDSSLSHAHIEKLQDTICQARQQKHVVLSWEGLVADSWLLNYSGRAARLRQLIPDTTVLLIVRDPVEWAMSNYKNSFMKVRRLPGQSFRGVKDWYVPARHFFNISGGRVLPRKAPSWETRKTRLNLTDFSIRALVEDYERHFGSSLVVVPFETIFSGSRVDLSSLEQRLDLEFGSASSKTENRSPDEIAYWLTDRLLNKALHNVGQNSKAKRRVINRLAHVFFLLVSHGVRSDKRFFHEERNALREFFEANGDYDFFRKLLRQY